MKVIESNGGPLLGISRSEVHHWSGIDGKRFIGEFASFPNDYEAAGYAIDGGGKPPCNVARIQGVAAEGLLIVVPSPTLIVASDRISIYIAQIESREKGWSTDKLTMDYFDRAKFTSDNVAFKTSGGAFVFFDSAYSAEDMEDNLTCDEIEAGIYDCYTAFFKLIGQCDLILYKILRRSLIES